jgi:hypothetical protein
MTHLKETTMDTRTASKELAEKVLRDAVADDGYGFVTEDGLEALVRAVRAPAPPDPLRRPPPRRGAGL